ncbi:copper resistance CopC family protein [Actinocrispum sp. NPDC049592]|uniref:copper resistance CopC family protein n=1 Tax=Actinocrispum sp. NPDC049592 TaxID=3154835 RepID=UPI003433DB25
MNLWRILLAVVTLLVVSAAPASAHVRLTSSNPEQGAALQAPPQSIQLTFDDALSKPPTVTVTDPNGTEWSMGRPTMDNKVLTVPCDPEYGPAGQYTVQYRVTGSDGHLIVGQLAFNLMAPFGQPKPPGNADTPVAPQAVPAAPADGGGVPLWIWIMGVVIVGGVVFVALWLRRTDKSDL